VVKKNCAKFNAPSFSSRLQYNHAVFNHNAQKLTGNTKNWQIEIGHILNIVIEYFFV